MTPQLYSNLTLQDALSLLRDRLDAIGNPPVGYLGQRGTDACCLKKILDLIDYPLHTLICLDYSREHETIANQVISMEKRCGQRRQWYSPALGKLFDERQICLPKELVLFCYSSVRQIESYCRKRGIRIVGNPYKLQQRFANKVTLAHLLGNLKMPKVNCTVHTLGSVNLDRIKKQINSDALVFQTPLGSSGTGTFFINDPADLAALGRQYGEDTLFKVTAYVSGPSYAVTGFISPGSLHWLPPALQVIGTDVAGTLARGTTVYAGSDFFVSDEIENRYMDWDLLERLALHLQEAGFMGIFNVDVLARGNYVVDLNPRCPGSIRMLTELSLANKEIPFVLLQLLSYLGCEIVNTRHIQQFDVRACLLVMHCLNNQVKTLETTIQDGIYSHNTHGAVYDRPGQVLDDFSKDEMLVTGGIPGQGVAVYPDAPMGRIWLKTRVTTDDLVPDLDMLNRARKVYDQYIFGDHAN